MAIKDPIKNKYPKVRLKPSDFFYPMTDATGMVLVHRLVMAKHLGRCLQRWEVVHHKDGDPHNSAIDNLVLTDTTDHSRMHKRRYEGVKYLTQDELRRLLAVIKLKSKRDYAIFLLAYHHGLRASEVGMIKMSDINKDLWRIQVKRLKNSDSGEYVMLLPSIKAVKAWLRERPDSPWLFPSQRRLPVSRFMLDVLMKQYGEEAGIPRDKRHFHVLKHSIATHMLDAGTDIRSVQDWIGHKNIQNTVVYAQISNRARDDLSKKLIASPMIVGT